MPRKRPKTSRRLSPVAKRPRSAKNVGRDDDNFRVNRKQSQRIKKSSENDALGQEPEANAFDEQVDSGRSYFESHRGVLRTTNLTLADLNIAPAARLEAALANVKDPLEDEQIRVASQIRSRFHQFLFMLSAEHSLLFYGYGSKRNLLEDFAAFLSENYSVIIINGFNPTVSLRSALNQIATDMLRIASYPKKTLLDYVDAIAHGIKHQKVAVVIHNVDGPCFRSPEAQHVLSTLASISGVSMIASIDHANAPLLWDGAMYSRYDWAWIKSDTFQPYKAETVFCSKPLLRGGRERRVEGAVALLKSLSSRARDVFRELAAKQAGDEKTNGETPSAHTRITFNQLFETAKTKFLASDPATLRLILTELETHDLLQRRRGADMAEQLWVPLESSQLKEVLSQVE